jgi:hypothetical protein
LSPSVEEVDALFQAAESLLNPGVPHEVRQRITTTRNLAVYGCFSYDLFTVSYYWSFTCVEMAIWQRSQEAPSKRPGENATLKNLLEWAHKYDLLPEHLSDPRMAATLADIRNFLTHPKRVNTLLTPNWAYDAFVDMVKVMNSLWPLVDSQGS